MLFNAQGEIVVLKKDNDTKYNHIFNEIQHERKNHCAARACLTEKCACDHQGDPFFRLGERAVLK